MNFVKRTIYKKLAKLNTLAMVIDSETEYCVFSDYSGHVWDGRIDICIARGKRNYHDNIARCEIYIELDNPTKTIKRINEVYAILKEILDTKHFSTKTQGVWREERIEYDHYF